MKKTFLKSILVLAVIFTLLAIGTATAFAYGYETKEMIVGETATFPYVTDYYGDTIPEESLYEWTVSTTYDDIISVDSNGVYTALAPGKARTYAYYYDNCSRCVKGNKYYHTTSFYIKVSEAEISEKFFFISTGTTDRLDILVDGNFVDHSQIKWRSEDESIATVSENGLVTGISYGQTMVHGEYKGVTFSSCITVFGEYNCTLSAPATMTTGETADIVLKDGNGNPVPSDQINWLSSEDSVIYMPESGKIVAVGEGVSTLVAEYQFNYYYFDVNVKDATISRTSYKMTTGTTLNLSLKDANGNKIANDKIQWETSKSTVATVSAKGAVKGVKAGTATITAVYQGKPYTCKVTVKNATLSKTSFSLVKGCTQKLTMKSASGSTIASKNITWKTSSKSIATVDKNGTVKGIKAGTATITGTYKGKAYTCKVTVKNMSLNKTSATLYMGDKLTLKVSGNSNKTTWSTSSKKIATVNSKGVVTPVKPGTVTITAKKNGETFKCKVTVKWPPEKGKTSTKSYTFNKAGSYNNYESELYTYELAGKGTIKVTAQIKEVGTANWSDYLRMSIEDDSFINIKEQTISYADGKVSISASVNPGKYYVSIGTYCKADVSISVTTKPTIIAPAKNLGRGYTHKFKVTGVKNKGTWSTSDKKIATVTSDGVVKGVKNGSCKIYYTMKDGKKLSYSVNIVNPVTLKVKYISDTTIYNECGVEICNNTGKKIEYTDFNITQYNYRGSKLRSPYDYYYCSVSVDPYSTRTREYWVHDNTGSVKLKLNFARFTDGKKYKP